jgi:hypothetical protein
MFSCIAGTLDKRGGCASIDPSAAKAGRAAE